MVGQTSVLRAVSGEGVPILSPDWRWACLSARSAPISKTSLGPGGLLSCLLSSSSPRSPPTPVFKALKPEDFYPSSSLCCEHQASAHTCPGHVHLAISGPLNLPQPQPTCPQTHPSALTVPQSSPAASPNSTLPAALTMTPALTGQTRVQLWIGTKAHGAAGQDTTVCPTHSFRRLWHNKNPSSSSLHLPCPPGSPEARARLSGGCSCPVSSTGWLQEGLLLR